MPWMYLVSPFDLSFFMRGKFLDKPDLSFLSSQEICHMEIFIRCELIIRRHLKHPFSLLMTVNVNYFLLTTTYFKLRAQVWVWATAPLLCLDIQPEQELWRILLWYDRLSIYFISEGAHAGVFICFYILPQTVARGLHCTSKVLPSTIHKVALNRIITLKL